MDAKNMPPLPEPFFFGWSRGGILSQDGYTADQMHAYARAYADQRVRPLVEAMDLLMQACDDSDSAMYGTLGVKFVRTVCKDALAAEQEHAK